MTESLSASNSVSRQVLADMRAAFRSYAKNSVNKEEEQQQEEKTYKDNGQITRKAFYDIQKAFPRTIETENKNETEEKAQEQQTNALQINTPDQDRANTNNININNAANRANAANRTDAANNASVNVTREVKKQTLPKDTNTIISELKRNGFQRTMTAYQIADKYGVSYMQAREILDKLNTDSNGFVREYNLPENSTISFKV